MGILNGTFTSGATKTRRNPQIVLIKMVFSGYFFNLSRIRAENQTSSRPGGGASGLGTHCDDETRHPWLSSAPAVSLWITEQGCELCRAPWRCAEDGFCLCVSTPAGMFTRMVKLRLLNAVAPAYFFMATAATFILYFCLFIPTIFPGADTSLQGSTTLHVAAFLFLMFNALGNYIMTIRYPAESANESTVPVCSPHCSDKVDAHYLLNGRHFCKLCKKVILKRDHHCFFTGNCIGNRNMRYFIMFCIYTSCTCLYSLVLGVAFLTVEYSISFQNPLTFLTLLPLTTGYFFMGTISGLQLFLVLMLYVWLGIGLVCAGFCCQQVLLVARGQTWCQLQRGELLDSHSPWRNNLMDVFGTRWILGLILPVQTVERSSQDAHELKQD